MRFRFTAEQVRWDAYRLRQQMRPCRDTAAYLHKRTGALPAAVCPVYVAFLPSTHISRTHLTMKLVSITVVTSVLSCLAKSLHSHLFPDDIKIFNALFFFTPSHAFSLVEILGCFFLRETASVLTSSHAKLYVHSCRKCLVHSHIRDWLVFT